MNTYDVELTDTFGGEANYSWVKRTRVAIPELTHYGYDGSNGYARADRIANRELMRRAKAAVGLTGVRGRVDRCGQGFEFRPYRACVVMFVFYSEDQA